MTNGGPTRTILLIDDHPDVRKGLALLLEEADVGRCCEAQDRSEALAIAEHQHPDLAVVDYSLRGGNTLGLLEELRDLHIPALVYSMHEKPSHVREAMSAGAAGYVTKGESAKIVRAIRDILEGWILISPRAAEGLRDE